jgi:hypothetical protein
MARDTAEAQRERRQMKVRCDAIRRAKAGLSLMLSDLRRPDRIALLHNALTEELHEPDPPRSQ